MWADWPTQTRCTRQATGYVLLGGAGDWAGWACEEHAGPPDPRPKFGRPPGPHSRKPLTVVPDP